ncbi:MAG: TonB-dependent receptor [Rheinheimera sp.]|nr:MAG: TonB-dependent receptor [Rheinheimera sp.]
MFSNNKTANAVRIALAFGAASTAAFTSASVSAQEQTEEAKEKVERIEVTGSRIKRVDVETASPVQITSSEDIKLSGFTKIEDLMNSLPQIEASETSFQANGASGNATLDLRGMGAQRTLVLVNGRRLQPGGINNAGAADVNQIPAALVERVEVLTGGGSATYGADAVAGVVNFVMKKDFEGMELTLGGSGYQHNNDNKYIQGLMDKRKFEYPTGSSGIDGKTGNIDLTMGGSLGSKGHVTAYATWRQVDELRQEARDYSSCALNDPGTACGGSGNAIVPNFFIRPYTGSDSDYDLEQFWTLDSNSKFIPSVGNAYNYAPINHFMRPDERYTFGAFANYEISEYVRPYLEVSFMNDRTVAQIAESGTFFAEDYILDINSPLFSDAQRAQFRSEFGADVKKVAASVGKRNVEGGPRQSDLEHTSFRMVVGTEGIINDTWSYDMSFQHGVTSSGVAYLNDFYGPRIAQALGAEGADPCTGSCVPYQIFKYNGVTPEQAKPLTGTAVMKGVTSETILNGFASGELGFNLPSHSMPVAAVIGVEHRENKFERSADEVFEKGLLLGQGGQTASIEGGYTVKEVFGELSIPLVEDVGIFKDVTLGLGGRYSDYSTSGGEPTYKAELDWTPVDDWKIRASYNRAVRAPNVGELFAPQTNGLWNGVDPCANKAGGGAPSANAEQCARTGVTAAQYGKITPSLAGQYNGLFGGNPDLKPEVADTMSFGIVGQPLDNLNLSIDYWDIKLDEVIGNVSAQLTVDQCIATGAAAFCDNIKRAPNGSLWIGSNAYVQATNINLASRHWRGIDVSSNYEQEVFGGKLTVKMIGSISMKKEYVELPGVVAPGATYDCSGNVSVDCFAQPKWRHTLSASYTTGDWWSATAKWRYFGKVDYEGTTDLLIPNGISAQSYLDLVGSFDVNDHVSLLAGVNNVLDKEPPMVGLTLSTNANTVSGYYDTLGRYLHASVTVRF